MSATVSGLGGISLPRTLPTSGVYEVRLDRAAKLVRLQPAHFDRVEALHAIVDGQAVTAAQLDGAGEETGTTVISDDGGLFAILDDSIAVGRWSLTVAAPA